MRNSHFHRFVVLAMPLALFAIVYSTGFLSADKKDSSTPHWNYEGETGPENWADLDPAFAILKNGKEQSPINLSKASKKSSNPLTFEYGESKLNLTNNGHTIQQNCAAGNSVTFATKVYHLKQFHFHSKSEHTIEGKQFDLEMHLVHQAETGEYLVVGILFELGDENDFLGQFWEKIPGKAGETVADGETEIDIKEALPESMALYSYNGSFTTPPGTEGVKWFVFANPSTISEPQLKLFRKLYSNNFRPVQPLHERMVSLFGE